jgi:hypothetical protein
MVESELLILKQKICAAAYANDVSIYLEDQEDKNLKEIIHIYDEEATGAETNFSKSKALPL